MTDERQAEIEKALLRMERAHRNGTGCKLTATMVHYLATTHIGEQWAVLKFERSPSPTQRTLT